MQGFTYYWRLSGKTEVNLETVAVAAAAACEFCLSGLFCSDYSGASKWNFLRLLLLGGDIVQLRYQQNNGVKRLNGKLIASCLIKQFV